MKKTMQLFQLFLMLCGFYGVTNFADPYKYWLPLGCLVLAWILDRLESRTTRPDVSGNAPKGKAVETDLSASQENPHLVSVLRSRNITLLVENIHWLLRDIGLETAACPQSRGLDRIVTLAGGSARVAVKVFADVDLLVEHWEQWERTTRFVQPEEGQRLLFIVGNAVADAADGSLRFKEFSQQADRLLVEKGVVAMTTQTLAELYGLCKQMLQDPDKIFAGIHRGPGGVFRL